MWLRVRKRRSRRKSPRNDSEEDNETDSFDAEPLPPLAEELYRHGGSYLYECEGDRLNWPHGEHVHYDRFRLPENWQKPRPLEAFAEFLGADAVYAHPKLRWFGKHGYAWEPRFVGHGSLSLFGMALEENSRRQDLVGHQVVLDLDLRLTGTERFHVQFRPIGANNTGGSYYQFSNPEQYVANTTGTPDRYWFEAELHSLVGADFDPMASLDYNITVGRVPMTLHNGLLINDELHAVILSKNTLMPRNISNLNLTGIYAFNDVSAFADNDAQMVALHAQIDWRRAFVEGTYAFVQHDSDSRRNEHFAAFSATQLFGPTTFAARTLFKWGDETGRGNGQLAVLEANRVRVFEPNHFGIEKGVFYANAFIASQGWNSIAGGNINRLTTALEVNPLVRIAAQPLDAKTWGMALGVQLFRHHEDQSWIPEVAYQEIGGEPVVGFGLRGLHKVSSRTHLEGLLNFTVSNDPRFDREGFFGSYVIQF